MYWSGDTQVLCHSSSIYTSLIKSFKENLIYFVLSVSAFIAISYNDLLDLSKYVGKDMSGSLGLPVLLSHINGDKFAELNILSLGGLVFLFFAFIITI